MTCETHEFRCLCCGKPTIPILRPTSRQKEKFHRKRLYCPNCKQEVNHIEIKNEEDRQIFLEKFKNGEYIEEAKESIEECKNSSLWKLL